MNDLGLAQGKVRLVKHNPKWIQLFEDEKRMLLQKFSNKILKISHGGSTALPTIPAKPIIDMFAVVQSLSDADTMKDELEKLGYKYLGEEGVPERRLAVKVTDERRTHHLQFVEKKSKEWKNHILLREYYLQHPEVALQYAELKRTLAGQFPDDRRSYTSGKNIFIKSILKMASEGQKHVNLGKKIVVVGVSAAGKSLFARRLADKLNLPVFLMDAIMWKPGWQYIGDEETVKRLQEVSAGAEWIIEGYISKNARTFIFDRADTIIYLDYSPIVASWRYLKRWWKHHSDPRPELEGSPDTFSFKFLKLVWTKGEAISLNKFLVCVEDQNKIIRITSLKETEAFLKGV